MVATLFALKNKIHTITPEKIVLCNFEMMTEDRYCK